MTVLLVVVGLTLTITAPTIVGRLLERRRDERRRRFVTQALGLLARRVSVWCAQKRRTPPLAAPTPEDPTGALALKEHLFPGATLFYSGGLSYRLDAGEPGGSDPWGNSVLYRCPGPVHRRGFDFTSPGPNGVDEGGRGDDIVAGEDAGLDGQAWRSLDRE